MFEFRPAPDSIAGVLNRFRTDILANNFGISAHANERMTQRGITLDQILDTVRNGQFGTTSKIDNFIGGCYFHKGIFVLAYAPFGDYNARPNVVTVFKQGEEDTPYIEDLITTKTVTEVKVVEKVVTKPVDDMSIEELSALLESKKQAKAAEETARKEKRVAELTAKQTSLLQQRQSIADELNRVEEELRLLKGAPQPISIPASTFEKAWADRVTKESGRINAKATAEKHGLNYADFVKWVKDLYPDQVSQGPY